MKLSFSLVALLVTCTHGYVTNNIKNTETTTRLAEVEKNEQLLNKFSANSENYESKIRSDYIYLEDVVAGLVHQDWADEELLCLNQTLELIQSLQNFTLWAVWRKFFFYLKPMKFSMCFFLNAFITHNTNAPKCN